MAELPTSSSTLWGAAVNQCRWRSARHLATDRFIPVVSAKIFAREVSFAKLARYKNIPAIYMDLPRLRAGPRKVGEFGAEESCGKFAVGLKFTACLTFVSFAIISSFGCIDGRICVPFPGGLRIPCSRNILGESLFVNFNWENSSDSFGTKLMVYLGRVFV